MINLLAWNVLNIGNVLFFDELTFVLNSEVDRQNYHRMREGFTQPPEKIIV